jgi:hypothetical protein
LVIAKRDLFFTLGRVDRADARQDHGYWRVGRALEHFVDRVCVFLRHVMSVEINDDISYANLFGLALSQFGLVYRRGQ